MSWLSYKERYRQSLKRLAVLTGLDENLVECPPASSLKEDSVNFLRPGEKSPLILDAEAEKKAADYRSSEASSGHLPKLFVAGIYAYKKDQKDSENQNYAAWIGITLPLFEGLRISSEVQRAKAHALEKENQLSAAQLNLDETNLRFDESIKVARIELELLKGQLDNAFRAFKLAKQRYLTFLGSVLDLQESLRNLARIESQINARKAEVLLALGSKAVLNGAVAKE
jgi:outer membrane protein TolC